MKFLDRRNYRYATIRNYRDSCNAIAKYVEENSLITYNADVCQKYCVSLLNGRDYSELDCHEKRNLRCAVTLLDFIETGSISHKLKHPQNVSSGPYIGSITEYLSVLENQRLSESTLKSNKLYLERFNDYCAGKGIKDISEITNDLLIKYVNSLNYLGSGAKDRSLSVIRRYLRFLYDSKNLDTDYSQIIPKSNYKKLAKLPSVYTDEEISKMLNAVDRGSPKGKRDYAMLLLATHLGLRSSDICQLQFTEIDWEHDTISIVQKKTEQRVDLPLLPIIGNAIIDYLKYGRPKSSSNYVFLRQVPDYNCLSYSTFHCIVTEYLLRAGISTDKRRHGPHALRHSLAGRLLEINTPIPAISEVLGHTNTESTKHYLRIDISKLQQCALEVPITDYYINIVKSLENT